jgi:hypothetical protein
MKYAKGHAEIHTKSKTDMPHKSPKEERKRHGKCDFKLG